MSDVIRHMAIGNLARKYPERQPTASEQAFFGRDGVPAYAAEDGRPVVDSSVTDPNVRESLLTNERYRLMMRGHGRSWSPYLGSLPLTEAQRQQFMGHSDYSNPRSPHGQQSMVARILARDPSAKSATHDQKMAALRLESLAALGQ